MPDEKRYKREQDYGFNRYRASLERVIADELSNTMVDGVAERAASDAESCADALSRLVAVLHHRGALTLDEVGEIVGCKLELVEPEPPPPEAQPKEKRRPRQPSTWSFDNAGKLKGSDDG